MAYKDSLERTKDYRSVFLHNNAGARVLEDLKAEFHYNSPTWVVPELGKEGMMIAEGQRTVVLWILRWLQEIPDQPRQEEADE